MSDEPTKKKLAADILLIVIGGMLGAVSSLFTAWLLNWQQVSREQKNTAIVLRHTVAQELALCRQAEVNIAGVKNLPAGTRLWPGGFDNLHTPSLYPELLTRVPGLDREIVTSVVSFDFRLRECQKFRDIIHTQLESMTNPPPAGMFSGYLYGISNVVETGEALLVNIDKAYPEIEK
ncbi:MAG: hypothetical protein C0404_05615 [Verrucomicrobia bacterium]|nr:hypothetical protein [Verrucomicrobiota bacterium]